MILRESKRLRDDLRRAYPGYILSSARLLKHQRIDYLRNRWINL